MTELENRQSSEQATVRQLSTSAARRRSDVPFFLIMGGLSSCFVLLIVLLIAADFMFTSAEEFKTALQKPEIRAAIQLTLWSCGATAILSLWVATPLGYLLS